MKAVTKKIFALLLSAIMLMATGVSAFADTGNSTTVNLKIDNKSGATYTAYKVMSSKVSGTDKEGNSVYTYTVESAFAGFFKDGENGYTLDNDNVIMKDGKAITSDGTSANTNQTEAARLANALKNYALANGITGTVIGDSGLDTGIGYYVIAETATTSNKVVASKPILVDLRNDKEITPKNSTVDLEKKIVEGEKKVDSNTANIGDTIKYEVTTSIPTYEANVDASKLSYTLTDTFTNLTYNNGSLVIKANGTTLIKDADYTLTEASGNFKAELTADAIIKYQGAELVLTYSAVLNEDAVVDNKDGNPNKIKLEYTNNPDVDNSKGELEDDVKTYTYGFKIHKVDKNDDTKDMAGAAFEVKDSKENVIGTFEYGEDGKITNPTGAIITKDGNIATIKGVDVGNYTITETKAPKDYSMLSEPVVIKIKDSGEAAGEELNGIGKLEIVSGQGTAATSVENNNGVIDLTVKIENVKGISLPETGGMTALYCMIGGVILIVFGGLYFGLSRRSGRKEQ